MHLADNQAIVRSNRIVPTEYVKFLVESEIWYVYIIYSLNHGRLYTGITNNVPRRLEQHNTNQGAKATKSGDPWKLVMAEKHLSKSSALKREYAIKQLSRQQKSEVIAGKR